MGRGRRSPHRAAPRAANSSTGSSLWAAGHWWWSTTTPPLSVPPLSDRYAVQLLTKEDTLEPTSGGQGQDPLRDTTRNACGRRPPAAVRLARLMALGG